MTVTPSEILDRRQRERWAGFCDAAKATGMPFSMQKARAATLSTRKVLRSRALTPMIVEPAATARSTSSVFAASTTGSPSCSEPLTRGSSEILRQRVLGSYHVVP